MKKTGIIILLFFTSIFSTEEPKREIKNNDYKINALKITNPVNIDGILDEEIWEKCYKITEFFQRDPIEGAEASEKTVVYIAYDNHAFYVAARMFDSSPDSIIARLVRRDVDINSDKFGVYLDPYFDRRSGFYFGLSAAGTYYDGILYNDNWDDDTWDGVWEGKTRIDEKGWTAEMRIPFSQLRFTEKEINVWGINFKREIARKNEDDFLVFIPKNESGFVSHFAQLNGINDIYPASSLEILPYITTKAEYTKQNSGNPFNDGSRYSPAVGADLKVGIGTSLNLNATINPDFGQVEIDPAVINLSDAETFFEEKRPFFIEGSKIFEFGTGGARNYWGFNWPGPDFFYSRRIGRAPQGNIPDNDYADVPQGTHILGAAKLTGKLNDSWNIGAISALTQREFAEISNNNIVSEVEVEPLTYYGVFRTQKEFNEGKQGIGFLGTAVSRFFNDNNLDENFNKNAFTGGIDGWTFLDSSKTWVLAGWSSVSHITGTREAITNVQTSSGHYFQRPDSRYLKVDSSANSLTGYAGRFILNKQKGNFFFNAGLGLLSPEYEINDIGFLSRTDMINSHIGAGYAWTELTGFSRYMELGSALFRSYNFDSDIIWEGVFHFGYIQFLNYYSLNWNMAYNPQTINNRLTRGGPLSINTPGFEINLSVGTDSRKNWVIYLNSGTYRKSHSYFFYINTSLELRPASNISFSINPFYEKNKDNAQYIDTFDDPVSAVFGKRYIFGELDQNTIGAGIRLNWTFTPELSLQLYAQPLISSGKYRNIKEFAHPKTYNFNTYTAENIKLEDDKYKIDPDGTGPAPELEFDNPDFNYLSLRGNAVLRWEYLPGSVLYLVWTQTRSDTEETGEFQFRKSVNNLFDLTPDNIFMIKFTYWFNM